MDRTNQFTKNDIEENKFISIFAYLGLLFVVPHFATDSPFAHFHAHQGFLFTINKLIFIVFILISNILISVLPLFSIVRTILLVAFFLLDWFYIIFGIVNTAKGRAKELPFIGTKSKN